MSGTYSAAFTATPIVEGDRAIIEAGPGGTSFTAAGTFADPGTPDTFPDSTVSYGDGTPAAALTFTGPRAFGVPAHFYAQPDDYTAAITIKDDDKGTSPSSTPESKVLVTAVKVGDLTVTDAAVAQNFVRSAGAAAGAAGKHLFVGESAGRATVLLDLAANPMRAEVARHLLWKVSGDDVVGPAAGNFGGAARPAVTLAPDDDAHRTFTVEAGFDDDGDGTLASTEVSRRAQVHVVRPDLDADTDNDSGPAAPERDAAEDALETTPPGKYVLLNDDDDDDDDDNNNDRHDFAEAPVAGENDLAPLVLGFEHLGTHRTGLKYQLTTAAGGEKVKVWADRLKTEAVALDTPAPVPEGGSRTVYVEGRALSQVEGDVVLEMALLAPVYASAPIAIAADDVRETVTKVDLDVDSDNTDAFNPQFPRSLAENAEDLIEDEADKPGKVVAVNDEDTDGDGVPDFADGFNRFIEIEHELSWGDQFVPLVMEVPGAVDPSRARFRFGYAASDPGAVTRSGAGTPADPWVYAPGPGGLRLWLKDGTRRRDEDDATENGDFVDAGIDYTAQHLDFDVATRKLTLWAEAVRPSTVIGDQRVRVELDPDGSGPAGVVADDAVRLTALDVDVLIGADDAADESLHDDWVGAYDSPSRRKHLIQNYVRVQGPADSDWSMTLDQVQTGPTGGTVTYDDLHDTAPTYGVVIGASGTGATPHRISGGTVSNLPEDVTLTASYKGQRFGFETLSVVKFATEPETYGRSPVPVNPLHVNSVAHSFDGNLFAADTGDAVGTAADDPGNHLTNIPGGATQPAINFSRKISPDKIEVVWGRHVVQPNVGHLARSTDDATLQVNPTNKGFAPDAPDNLRMRDTGFPALFDNSPAGTVANYYLGHPTLNVMRQADVNRDIQFDHAAKIVATPIPQRTYNVAVHLIDHVDPNTRVRTPLGITTAEAAAMVDQASTVWSQVGVNFVIPTGQLFWGQGTNEADRFDVEDDFTQFGSSTDELTDEFKTPLVDLFVVNSIYDPGAPPLVRARYLSGVTIYSGLGRGTPGVLVAAKLGLGPADPRRSVDSMARTLAHELGHYLMKLPDSAHKDAAGTLRPDWNLMVAEGPGSQRDLLQEQSDRLRKNGVNPATPDQ